MIAGPTTRAWWTTTVIAGAAAILAQIYLWPHITDDAYITFRYAYNLAHGNGLAFNPGEFVEGFSNPLWTLALALLHFATGIDLPDLARTSGFLFSLGTLVLVFLIARRSAETSSPLPVILTATMIVLSPGFHVYATAGLEGPLLGFLLILGVALSFRTSPPHRLGAALAMGLAGITRPEAPLYALLWFLSTIHPALSVRRLFRLESARFLVMVFPIIAWQTFRLIYFGTWLPNTAIAKVPGVFGEFIGFPEYVTPWIVAAGGPLLLLLWMVLPARSDRLLLLERMCLALVGGNLIFVAYAQGDWMAFGRFIAPIWPVGSLMLALWISAGVRELRLSAFVRFRPYLAHCAVAGVALASVLAWYPSVQGYVRNEGMNMLMRGTDQIAVGRWIDRNIARDATIATGRLGGISYGALSHVVWDWFGLTDAEEAAHIRKGRPGTLEDDPVFRRKPDVIAAIEAPADWSYKRTAWMMDFLQENYIFVVGFPQGRYGHVDVWIRKEQLREILVTGDEFVF